MKILISILIVLGVIFTGWKLVEYWGQVETEEARKEEQANAKINPSRLEGLSKEYERKMNNARKKGSNTFKDWIDQAKSAGILKDPRLAWVELDYVVMIIGEDPVKAKKIYLDVKKRLSEDSPVYPRLKSLSETFE